ncbi:MAG TPA: pyridoxal phosphate-dependent aminotransferase [Tissierellia bacterium]|nr:pyridoxal phosphate-dependent aminotransferase [Tissierellia bacterium]
MLSNRAKALSPSITLGISARVKTMKAEGIPVINLSIGEPDFVTPDCAKAGGTYAIENDVTKYDAASGNLGLRQEICRKLKDENGLDYTPEQIVVSSGAKHSITNAVMATVNDGEEVIIPVPYWVSYPEIVELLGAKAVLVQTKKDNGFLLTVEDVKDHISDKTRMVILTNPSNPTGNAFTRDQLQELCQFLVDHNILILSDEIYERIVYDEPFTSVAALSDEIKEKTIVVNGLSKSASMTGWRIGYTASTVQIAKAMGSIQSHLTSHPSTVSMQAAKYALRDCGDAIEHMRQTYQKRRDFIVDFFEKELPQLSIVPPKGAFYVFADMSVLRDKLTAESLSMKVCEDMLDREVAFVPGIGFGADDFIRISYAASMDDIKEGLQRLKAYVEETLR